ncbi:hypothetical protein [Bacillus mycoides]|uniref:DUF4376 domain-containing protein n=1 Tax=Bacillus mycoides (strain KBAB4) TaxID=315730 RepID=A9VV03_BACMK|nr:hypothetical protein [Bacillus mycoides]ABY46435.1 hypothetical protein BcerKBAB4_5443 [Bacillus mycoides KBAB4]
MENIENIEVVGEVGIVEHPIFIEKEEPVELPISLEVEHPCWEVDEEGYVVEHYLMSDSKIEIALSEGRRVLKSCWKESFYKPRFDEAINDWVEGADMEEILNLFKTNKFDELNQACNKDISGYFDAPVGSETYTFSFDGEAQANFIGSLALFNEGLMKEVEWTAWKGEKPHRVNLSKEQFMNVAFVAYQEKDTKISKLRNTLQPRIEACTTIEEVQAIYWNEKPTLLA